MKNLFLVFSSLLIASCGKSSMEFYTPDSSEVTDNQQLITKSIVIDISDISPGLACANGGVALFSFYDSNNDGTFQDDETIIKTKSVCNGINGTNGSNASITLETITQSLLCPQGGVKISSTTAAAVEVCNGANGLNGAQGIQGVQGVPGIGGTPGTPGTIVTPVKFCKTDNSTFPEYGLMIGDELFAVYWGVTPGSPNAAQAFLTKLIPGNYQSTGGNNCLFAIP